MGKKKQQKEQNEDKGKKTYSLANTKQDGGGTQLSDALPKVSIPGSLEKDLLDLIKTLNQERQLDREISKRLTNKKLMDIYTSLNSAGFSHKHIEQSMETTILHGGDLIDALDWLCLNLPNDKLPSNFSQTLQKEEDKKQRPQFDLSQQVSAGEGQQETPEIKQVKQIEQKEKQSASPVQPVSEKDWILQYSQQASDDSDLEDEEDGPYDPNERYLELTALLLDAKQEATEVKKSGDKVKQKHISKHIRQYIMEMESLEQHPDFNSAIKLKDIDEIKKSKPMDTVLSSTSMSHDQSADKSHDSVKSHDRADQSSEAEDVGMMSLFQETAEPEPKVKASPVIKVKEDFRSFEYTRQQWTGKSPKQFLIDWCRKHLPKSPPPKFEKVSSRGNKFKCKVKIDRKKDGMMEECPEILCGNVKEAEHLAATLALYNLCKGQCVYQLLPPAYRDVWLEWSEAEKQAQMEEKTQENKPRDQFLSKLMSKIQLCDKGQTCQDEAGVTPSGEGEEEDILDSWETLDVEQDTRSVQPNTGTRGSRNVFDNVALKQAYVKHQSSALYQELYKSRQELPVYHHRDNILEMLGHHNVILIAGETGSGKSTQVPHFILQDCLLSSGQTDCNIVCTEPRRISAISLAGRVSQEMGEYKLGGVESLCGYQIRFESKCGPNTRLTYCTTGVLLRKLQIDPHLKHVTHIIVDEVHERSVQSDFLLIILKKLLHQRSDLKVILMSATLDAGKFSSYFQHCPLINIPGRTFPVEVYHVEDIIERVGYVLEEDSPYTLHQSQLVKEDKASVSVTERGGHQAQMDVFWTTEDVAAIDRTDLAAENYSLKTRNTVTRLNLKRINMDLIVALLLYLDTGKEYRDIDGAVLIFLPGLADITELYETLDSDRRFSDKNRYKVIALHSVLSSSDQAAAFTVPPSGVRKIVLATNIAETGITIPDVVFVIDTGKVKENRYIETSQMNALEEVWISKANAKQRQGRAGRVQSGYCFRLFTKQLYEDMRAFTVPEILRVPLEELCLHIMKCDYGRPESFLSLALDPPQSQVMNRAMNLLHTIGACVEGEKLTPLGHHLAALPVHVRIGKMLLYAAVFGCLEPVAVIAASMTDKSPFMAPLGKQDLANTAKQTFAVASSDHLTFYKAYLGWKESRTKGRQAEMSFCQKNFLKRNTLLEIENVKTDLIKLIDSIGFLDKSALKPVNLNTDCEIDGVLQISKYRTVNKLDQRTIAKVKAILTAGLYPNVAKLFYEAPVDAAANPDQRVCVGETQQGPAHVHPASINRHLQANGWLVYHQKVKSTRVYLRDCCLVTAYPLLLFGGEIQVQHTDQLLSVDDRIKYKAYAKTGVIFKELRKLLDDLLASKLENPTEDITNSKLVSLIEDLLTAEKPSR